MLSQNPSARETKLAKALVHPEKAVRDRTLKTLIEYLSSLSALSEQDWLKLWKALYYCMWLADKSEVQQELANSLASIAESLRTTALQVKYFRSFYQIMLREWSFLDQYRVNKFYMLFRVMLNKVFAICKKNDWDSALMETFVAMLTEEVLTKQPNGVRYHICDIFLDELSKVGGAEIATSTFWTLIGGFLRTVLLVDVETPFIERVYRSVFQKFLNDFVHSEQEAAAAAAENATAPAGFPLVRLTALQKKFFDIASAEETSDRHRKRLYDLHKEFANKTGLRFVEEEDQTEPTQSKKKVKAAAKKQQQQEEESKKVEDGAPVAVTTKASTPATPAVVESKTEEKKKSKKRKNEESTETTAVAASAQKEEKTPVAVSEKEPVATSTDDSTNKKKKVKNAPIAEETATPAAAVEEIFEQKKEKKDKKKNVVEKKSEDAPAVAAPAAAAAPAAFIESKKFAGAKDGYMFQKGVKGIGYYLDKNRPAKRTPFAGNANKKKHNK